MSEKKWLIAINLKELLDAGIVSSGLMRERDVIDTINHIQFFFELNGEVSSGGDGTLWRSRVVAKVQWAEETNLIAWQPAYGWYNEEAPMTTLSCIALLGCKEIREVSFADCEDEDFVEGIEHLVDDLECMLPSAYEFMIGGDSDCEVIA